MSELARDLARELAPGDRVLLEGPMGAGKSTFARALLDGLGASLPPEGSPTFAIAHEYPARAGLVIHADVYRLEEEAELEATGLESALWEREGAIVVVEWLSKFPDAVTVLAERYSRGVVWRVDLAFDSSDSARRAVVIERSGG